MPNSRLRRTHLPLTAFALLIATLLIATSVEAATYRHQFVGAVGNYAGDVPSVVSEGARVEIIFEHGDAYRSFDDTRVFPGGEMGPTTTRFTPLVEPIEGPVLAFRFVEAMSMTVLVGQEVISEYRVNTHDIYRPSAELFRKRPVLAVADDALTRVDPGDIFSPVVTIDQLGIVGGQVAISLTDPSATYAGLRPGLPTSFADFDFDPVTFNIYLETNPDRPGTTATVSGAFSSITSTVVPEPSAALLIGLGLAALSRRRPVR